MAPSWDSGCSRPPRPAPLRALELPGRKPPAGSSRPSPGVRPRGGSGSIFAGCDRTFGHRASEGSPACALCSTTGAATPYQPPSSLATASPHRCRSSRMVEAATPPGPQGRSVVGLLDQRWGLAPGSHVAPGSPSCGGRVLPQDTEPLLGLPAEQAPAPPLGAPAAPPPRGPLLHPHPLEARSPPPGA